MNSATDSEDTLFERKVQRRGQCMPSFVFLSSYRKGLRWHMTARLQRWMEVREEQRAAFTITVGNDRFRQGPAAVCSAVPMCFTVICYKTVITTLLEQDTFCVFQATIVINIPIYYACYMNMSLRHTHLIQCTSYTTVYGSLMSKDYAKDYSHILAHLKTVEAFSDSSLIFQL